MANNWCGKSLFENTQASQTMGARESKNSKGKSSNNNSKVYNFLLLNLNFDF